MTLRFTVGAEDLAVALGSGDVPVLATPRLVAWLEAATVAAAAGSLRPGETTVGTRVVIDHLAASPLGAVIDVSAELLPGEGRRLRFDCEAVDERGTLVARATVERARVDREAFLRRLSG